MTLGKSAAALPVLHHARSVAPPRCRTATGPPVAARSNLLWARDNPPAISGLGHPLRAGDGARSARSPLVVKPGRIHGARAGPSLSPGAWVARCRTATGPPVAARSNLLWGGGKPDGCGAGLPAARRDGARSALFLLVPRQGAHGAGAAVLRNAGAWVARSRTATGPPVVARSSMRWGGSKPWRLVRLFFKPQVECLSLSIRDHEPERRMGRAACPVGVGGRRRNPFSIHIAGVARDTPSARSPGRAHHERDAPIWSRGEILTAELLRYVLHFHWRISISISLVQEFLFTMHFLFDISAVFSDSSAKLVRQVWLIRLSVR